MRGQRAEVLLLRRSFGPSSELILLRLVGKATSTGLDGVELGRVVRVLMII